MITMEGTLGKVSDHVNLLEILANHMRHKIQSELDLKTQMMQWAQVLYTNVRKGAVIPSMSADVLKQLKNGHLTLHVSQDPDMKTLREQRRNNHNLTLAIIIGVLYLSGSLMTISEIPKMLYGMPFISWVEYLVGTVLLVRLLLDLTKHV
jgi:ubiquinone biosynthesis protein